MPVFGIHEAAVRSRCVMLARTRGPNTPVRFVKASEQPGTRVNKLVEVRRSDHSGGVADLKKSERRVQANAQDFRLPLHGCMDTSGQ